MRFRFLFKFSRLGILIYRGMTLILPRFGPTRRQESGTSWSTWPPSVAKRLLSRPWARCWSVKGIVISLDTNLFRISTIGFEQTFGFSEYQQQKSNWLEKPDFKTSWYFFLLPFRQNCNSDVFRRSHLLPFKAFIRSARANQNIWCSQYSTETILSSPIHGDF